MAYWICVTNSVNWGVTKEKNVLGASERHSNALSRVNEGDKCLIYVMSERIRSEIIDPKIVAEYQVDSEVFRTDSKIFYAPEYKPDETFPLRIKVKPIEVFEKPIDFKSLTPQLAFIKNKKRWSLNLKGKAMVQISEEDYDLIRQHAN